MSTESMIKKLCLEYFDDAGFASVDSPSRIDVYKNWIDEGRHGKMTYLERHLEKKTNPSLLLKDAKTWISLATYYDTKEPLSVDIQQELMTEKKGWVSRYARGEDYHDLISRKHGEVIQKISQIYPDERFVSCVDFKPVLERDVGVRAGLGWIGKNGCLIHPEKGSFIFLSEILTTLSLEMDRPVADHCGTCTKCLEACPTSALLANRTMDAKSCISYWTIEVDESPPTELKKHFGMNVFGCDICQDVCPWNQKARRKNALQESHESGKADVYRLLEATEDDLRVKFEGTSLSRAKPNQIKRSLSTYVENLTKLT
jgi:epoxyqueuosine reductase